MQTSGQTCTRACRQKRHGLGPYACCAHMSQRTLPFDACSVLPLCSLLCGTSGTPPLGGNSRPPAQASRSPVRPCQAASQSCDRPPFLKAQNTEPWSTGTSISAKRPSAAAARSRPQPLLCNTTFARGADTHMANDCSSAALYVRHLAQHSSGADGTTPKNRPNKPANRPVWQTPHWPPARS